MSLPSLVDILLGLLAAYYSLVVLGLTVGLRRLNFCGSIKKPFVSVIVAARNEEKNIENLLQCLVLQDYPTFEIIIVNDRSSDQTATLVERFQRNHSSIRRVDISSPSKDLPAKKHALAQGIGSSKGEILCFTDADCLPPPAWISSLVAAFDESVGLATGYSPYNAPKQAEEKGRLFLTRLFFRFIDYEEFKGAIWAAGAIGMRRGWLCTGRSLAYRRRVYDEVGGFEKIKQSVSGDDDLFLQLVRRQTSWKIRYITSPQSFVPTLPPSGFNHFIQQRVRHFSAGIFFPLPMKTFFLVFHASNLAMFLSLLGSIWFGTTAAPVWPYLLKCVFDSMLFFKAAPMFGQTSFAASFLFMEVFYIFYNALIGPLGFIKRFEWKPETRP